MMFSTSSSSTTPSGTNMLDFSCFCFFSFSFSSIAQAPPSSVPFPKTRFPASSVSLFHSNTSASSEASLLKFVSSNRLNFLIRSSLSFVFATASRSIALILWFRSFFALLDCVRSRYSFGSCPWYSFAVKYFTSGKSDVRKRLCCFSSRTVLNDFDFKDDDVFSVKAAHSLSSPSRGFLSPSSSSSSPCSNAFSSSSFFSSFSSRPSRPRRRSLSARKALALSSSLSSPQDSRYPRSSRPRPSPTIAPDSPRSPSTRTTSGDTPDLQSTTIYTVSTVCNPSDLSLARITLGPNTSRPFGPGCGRLRTFVALSRERRIFSLVFVVGVAVGQNHPQTSPGEHSLLLSRPVASWRESCRKRAHHHHQKQCSSGRSRGMRARFARSWRNLYRRRLCCVRFLAVGGNSSESSFYYYEYSPKKKAVAIGAIGFPS
mmetsp:Transcript_2399/g.8586  ORF Transcript_2399/g.8586 Transcript_2399/m.8586 type:complete len:429 (+) Transcript_2399:2412-3698(+)